MKIAIANKNPQFFPTDFGESKYVFLQRFVGKTTPFLHGKVTKIEPIKGEKCLFFSKK